MRDMDFFEPVRQHPTDWHGRELMRPVFYYDFTSVLVSFLTPLKAIRARLPSKRLHPLRFTPRTAVTTIALMQHRDSDIGPYNVVAIAFPVTIDRPAPIMLGLLRIETNGGAIFPWQMPEDSQLAVDVGVDVAGYPKFMADIEIESKDGWLRCHVAEAGSDILTLSIRPPKVDVVSRRWPGDLITVRDGFVQRVPYVSNIRNAGRSSRPSHARLELGDHPVANELRDMDLGRPVNIQYSASSQQILGTVLEGWPADRPVDRWTSGGSESGVS